MVPKDIGNVAHDLAAARQICENLRAGKADCLAGLFIDYNELFLNFARRRVFKPGSQEDVVQSFWEELINAKAICRYAQGTGNSACLRTYLLGILYFRIIDANRKNSRDREIVELDRDIIEGKGESITSQDDGILALGSERLIQKLVHEALLGLSEHFPQDASLVHMYLEGLNYPEMARRSGKHRDAVKKQFTREQTGSLAKFKRALTRIMQGHGLSYADL